MVKIIAVNEEVYSKLQKLKGKLSFSSAIDRLIEKKSDNISKYFGVWRSKKNLDEIENEIIKNRKIFASKRKTFASVV